MILPADAQDRIVAGQADFHQHVALGHLMKKIERVVFMHYGDSVPNAFGVALLDRLADVKVASPSGGTRPIASSPACSVMCTLG